MQIIDLRTDILAWLGEDWTPGQTEVIIERIGEWERANLLEDDEEVRSAAWDAIAQQVDGALDFDEAARRYGHARAEVAAAKEAARAAVWVQVTYGGMGESEAARIMGVDRMTIRAWLGKR